MQYQHLLNDIFLCFVICINKLELIGTLEFENLGSKKMISLKNTLRAKILIFF